MTNVCIVIIHKPGSLSSRLTQWATGSTAMHIGFVVNGKFYDQHLIMRRRRWPHYGDNVRIDYYKCPVQLTQADLEYELDTRTETYGVLDYCLFALRKLMPWRKHWPSYKGAICSEMVEAILAKYGWASPFKNTPSPADFEKVLEKI